MYRIIGADKKEYGPVSVEQIKEWIAQGRANGASMALADGTEEWKPLSELPEFAEALAAKTASPLHTPAPAPQPDSSEAWAAEILSRDYEIFIGDCVSRGWALLVKNFWPAIGAGLLALLIVGTVPLLAGVLYGGLYLFFLKQMRGEKAELGDVFSGFSIAFLNLFVGGLVMQVLLALGFICCIIPGIFLAVAWTFAIPLMIDKKLDFWPAMELSRKVATRHWWQLLGLLAINVLIIIVGHLALCVGFLVAFPLTFAALAYAYEDVFNVAPASSPQSV
jgi:hypothetical protein